MRAVKLNIPSHLEEIIRKVAENQAIQAELQTLQSDLIQNSAIDDTAIAAFLLELNLPEIKPQFASLLKGLHEHRRLVIEFIFDATKNLEQEKNTAQAHFYSAYLSCLEDSSLEKCQARNFLQKAKELGHPAAEKALIKLEIEVCREILLKSEPSPQKLGELAALLGISVANKKADKMLELVMIEILKRGLANTEGKTAGLDYLSEYADFLCGMYKKDSLLVLAAEAQNVFKNALGKLISPQLIYQSEFSEGVSRMIKMQVQIARNLLQNSPSHRENLLFILAVTLSNFSSLFPAKEGKEGPVGEAISLYNQILTLKPSSSLRAKAFYNLGLIYYKKRAPGMNSNTSSAEAVKLALPDYQKAAELQYWMANEAIAKLYLENQIPNLAPETSLRETIRLALPYLESAARQGSLWARERLARIYCLKLAPQMNLSTPFHESLRSALPYQQLVGSKLADKWQKAYLDIRDTEAGRSQEEAIQKNLELNKLKSRIANLEEQAALLEYRLYKKAFLDTLVNETPEEEAVSFMGMSQSQEALNLDNLGALAVVKQEPEEEDFLNEAGKRSPSPGLFPPPKEKEEADDSNRKRAKIDGPGN